MKSKLFELSGDEIAMVGGGGSLASLDETYAQYAAYYKGSEPLPLPSGGGYSPAPETVDPARQKMVYDAYAAYQRK